MEKNPEAGSNDTQNSGEVLSSEKSDYYSKYWIAQPSVIAVYLSVSLIAFLLVVFFIYCQPFGISICPFCPSPERMRAIKLPIYSFCFGGIGGTCYSIRGFYKHVAANDYKHEYVYWYLFRGPLGAILGMVCYFLTQGGILVFANASLKDLANHPSSFRSNAFICGLAFLAGYSTNQFTDKMQDLSRTLFGQVSHKKKLETLKNKAQNTYQEELTMNSGYIQTEAEELLELCIQLNGDGVNNSIPPYSGNWKPIITKVVIPVPFDNAWSLWKKDNSLCFVARGTVPKDTSIIEDLLVETIPANDGIDLGGGQYLSLNLASQNTQGAAVHFGFALGLAVILFHRSEGILNTLTSSGMDIKNETNIYVTGHSQGAAIATLLHSFLVHANPNDLPWVKGKNLKSYVFAQPKPGNWQFAMDFARAAGNDNLAYCINNPLDWVPQVPLTRQGLSDLSDDPITPYLRKHYPLAAKAVLELEAKFRDLKSDISAVAGWTSRETLLGNLRDNILPQYIRAGSPLASGDLNYTPCGILRSTRMQANLANIVPNYQEDPLAQHHLVTYKSLL